MPRPAKPAGSGHAQKPQVPETNTRAPERSWRGAPGTEPASCSEILQNRGDHLARHLLAGAGQRAFALAVILTGIGRDLIALAYLKTRSRHHHLTVTPLPH